VTRLYRRTRGLSTAGGDEGGFAPNLTGIDALDAIGKAVEKAGYKLGEDIFFALDAASSEYYDAESNASQEEAKVLAGGKLEGARGGQVSNRMQGNQLARIVRHSIGR
jgi:enolase